RDTCPLPHRSGAPRYRTERRCACGRGPFRIGSARRAELLCGKLRTARLFCQPGRMEAIRYNSIRRRSRNKKVSMSVRVPWLIAPLFLPFLLAAAPPSVILISIDTLRADHLSAYGYRAVHTPGLDGFRDRGTQFLHADAQVPLTLPSHLSLFTSTYPFENRIEENAEPVPPGAETLASVLHSHGYATAAFVS